MVYGYQNLLQIRLDHDTSAKSVFTFQGRKQQRFFIVYDCCGRENVS